MQEREVLLRSKTYKDFPKKGAWAVIGRSISNSVYPEDLKQYARAYIKCNGIVCEDAPEIKGTKITWI